MVVIIVFILGAIIGSTLYLMYPAAPTTTSTTRPVTPTTTSPGLAQPRITDVVPEGFVLVGGEIYWRIKIYGEVDLRNYTTISGVYGSWFGRINVILPSGEGARLHEPPDYTNIVTQFSYLRGVKVLDVYIPTSWYENPCLEGVYRVTVWLKGPYENRTTLFDKNFTYRMDLKATISPTTWTSWNENLKLVIANTGEVPLIITGVGIERNGTVIGWVLVPPEEIVMPGESKELAAQAQILDNFREELKGKSVVVDFVLSIVAAPRRYAITNEVRFPVK